MSVKFSSFLLMGFLWINIAHSQNASELVYLEQGVLTYEPFSMTGQSNAVNTIPDFSYAGYMGGGVPLPTDIPVVLTINPEEGEDSERIQDAIDIVEALEPDERGFRGVILIKAGHYSLENQLGIRESGVVLRGEGQGLNGTVLHSNQKVAHSIISIIGSGDININSQSEQAITSEYVPVGSYSFAVEDGAAFEVGDRIVVTRTPNQFWIDELEMDQEPLCQGKTGCNGWTTSSYTIEHERIITGISGNNITIDIPIVDVIEATYGGGVISKIESSRRISQCGIENMRIMSFYDSDFDEVHAWTAIRLKDSENCWVKQVTGQYLAYSTVNIDDANFTTVQDCAYIDPKSLISGGRRYPFAIQEGIGNLVQRCYAVRGRHDFTTGSRVTGPNVFLDGLAENAQSDIGPHHRWATGTLFDNIRGGSTRVWNRGNSGSGHGWAGAQTMFWNIESYGGEFRVDSPLGAMNWGVGCIGRDQTGEGYWESWGTHVEPRSLYLQQLKDRLGQSAVDNITIPEQQSGDIYDILDKWGGNGNFSDGGFTGVIPDVSFLNPTNSIDVSTWDASPIELDATDIDGTVQSVKLLINGEPVAIANEAPYIFDISSTIQNLSHDLHYLQAIATDDDGNTNLTRMAIMGGDPPTPIVEDPMDEEFSEIRVYPNPIQNRQLTIEMKENDAYTVKVFDLYGRIVDHIKFQGNQYQYFGNNIAEGIFLIEIENETEVLFTGKFMVQ
jgi:hypothetical protein